MRNFTIAAALVGSFLLFTPAFAAVEISDGSVVGLYHLEDTADASGNGFNLTNNGGVSFVPAKLSNGADSGSSNSTKDLTIANNLGIAGGDFTIFLWYKNTTAVNGDGSVLASLSNSGTPKAIAQLYSWNDGTTHVRFSRSSSGDDNCGVNITHTLSTSTYELLTITYDAGTVEGFLDNVSQGTNTCTGNTGASLSNAFSLLSRNSQAATYASGIADEVIVMNRVATAPEIAAIFNAGAGAEVCVAVGCATGGGSSSTTASTTLSASDAVLTYLLFILDALWLAACLWFFWSAFRFVFNIRK